MNDLELVRTFRDEIQEPTTAEVQAARMKLLATLDVPTNGARAEQRHVRRWRIGTAIALAAALAVVAPMVLPFGRGGADPAAASALRHAALVASTRSADTALAAGQYVYTKTSIEETMYFAAHSFVLFRFARTQTLETWTRKDGSGRILSSVRNISFPSDADRAAWIAAGSPDLRSEAVRDENLAAGDMQFIDLTQLPSDPVELKKVLERRDLRNGPSGDAETFRLIADLLRYNYAPASIRKAMYEVVASLSGVHYLGATEDATGRSGTGVSIINGGWQDIMIFDPQTSLLLGESDGTTTAPSVGANVPGRGTATIEHRAAYVDSGIVDSLNDRI